MKRIVFAFLTLALVLAACGAPPTPVTIIITATDEPVVATEPPPPTDIPAPTDAPAATETTAPAAAPTETTAPAAAPSETSAGPAPTNTRPPAVGGDVFVNITHDIEAFALRCSPSQINFTLSSVNPAITSVDFYYRVRDKNVAVQTVNYIRGKEMVGDGKGNYTLEFSALDVHPDQRKAVGWFDYQFIGINKFGDVVGRSERFEDQITFTLDCP